MNTSFQGTSEKGTNVWITPKKYIDALGPFDFDPCANEIMPWRTANIMLTEKDDGLKTSWSRFGRGWLNPPYNRNGMDEWLDKNAKHANGNGVVFASTDVDWFDYIWAADALLFTKARINFLNEFGELPINPKTGKPSGSGKGSVFFAHGLESVLKLKEANESGIIPGKFRLHENYKLV